MLQWCQGLVVAVKNGNKLHVEWDDSCLRDGDPNITEEKFMVSKWNKHTEGAWRLDLARKKVRKINSVALSKHEKLFFGIALYCAM